MAAQIKLTEVWKVENIDNYAISLDPYNQHRLNPEAGPNLRAWPNRIFNDSSRLKISQQSFSVDEARLWNQAPTTVREAPTLGTAKAAILTHVRSLPVWNQKLES